MSINARLTKLMPVISAKERATLVLRALQGRTPEDPSWRSTMPVEQTADFNHYIYLMNACSIHLPIYIMSVQQRTDQLWDRLDLLLSLMQGGKLCWELSRLVPVGMRPAAEALAEQSSSPRIELPWDGADYANSWLNVADAMYAGMRVRLVALWQEMQSIDVVVDEVAQEFDGEDLLRPIMRKVLEKARRDLTLLHGGFDKDESLELPEPDEESMTLARKYFDNGYQLMSGL